MKTIFLLTLFLFNPAFSLYLYAQDLSDAGVEVMLSDEEIEAFRKQAMESVTDLSRYIRIIGEKSREESSRRKTVQLATGLFISEDNVIEASSLKEPKPIPYPVAAYFNRLLKLRYSAVSITWYKIYLSNDFKQGADGRYYGTATIYQRFEGRFNRETGGYRDVTRKKITLIVTLVNKYKGPNAIHDWQLKLGDIKVEEIQ